MLLRLLVVCVWVMVPIVSNAETNLHYRIYEMPTEVVSVQTEGQWQQGTRQGYFRLIITAHQSRYLTHQLWIQWICDCEEGRVSMVNVTEISHEGPFRIVGLPEFGSRGKVVFLNLTLENAHTHEKFRAQVQIIGPGSYRFVSERLRQ
ncbi:hypothetical protein [Gynuella sunshinyii]|uniref:Uncharacterized protein n=1 Tax=Gynuella sunshinyii YC6258 TaxID=1445510 RepID=A0A0C5VB17_9GAMM|nr:hypothetical protein [Gynuella sunshinyii]AJQ96540.1 hypothetical Protein YC6258_04508 [Gynuella sunshinyii YC6258]